MALATIGGGEAVVIVVIALMTMGPPLWAAIDAAQQPQQAWERRGSNKAVWVGCLSLSIFVTSLGLVLAIYYFLRVRPELRGEKSLAR